MGEGEEEKEEVEEVAEEALHLRPVLREVHNARDRERDNT